MAKETRLGASFIRRRCQRRGEERREEESMFIVTKPKLGKKFGKFLVFSKFLFWRSELFPGEFRNSGIPEFLNSGIRNSNLEFACFDSLWRAPRSKQKKNKNKKKKDWTDTSRRNNVRCS